MTMMPFICNAPKGANILCKSSSLQPGGKPDTRNSRSSALTSPKRFSFGMLSDCIKPWITVPIEYFKDPLFTLPLKTRLLSFLVPLLVPQIELIELLIPICRFRPFAPVAPAGVTPETATDGTAFLPFSATLTRNEEAWCRPKTRDSASQCCSTWLTALFITLAGSE